MATLLQRLVSGSEDTRSILLQDSSRCVGRLLLKAIALHSLQRFSYLHVFLFDEHPEPWLHGVSGDIAQRLTVHDYCTDHLGWNSSGPSPLQEATPTKISHDLNEEATPTPEIAVVIDSLSTLLDYHSAPQVCRLTHRLGRQCGLVMGQLHSDLHDNHVTSQLSHVMSTSIEITSSLQPDYQFQLQLLHHKTSGKQLRSNELVSISSNYELMSQPFHTTHTVATPVEMRPPDPTVGLTFDLRLSERERAERDRLVLPYQHSAEKKTALLQAGSGRIFYQPDEADDYDDSDPDNDLDI